MPASSTSPVESTSAGNTPNQNHYFNYGWVNIVLAAMLMLATLPGRTQGLGLITEPLLNDLHLDRIAYADINLWATLLGAAFCFPAGYLIDRFGLRLISTALVLSLGLTVWRLSQFAGNVAGLFCLLFLTRAFGQSALSVASITAAGKTFGRRLGPAMGIYSFLLSIFFVIAFVVVGASVSNRGWRIAWEQIAAALTFVIAPLTFIFLRQSPQPASTDKFQASEVSGVENTPVSFTLPQALRTLAFWVIGLGAALFNLVSSGLGLFNEAVLAEHGFNQQTFHEFLAVTTLMTLVGQLICGWMALHHPFRRLMGLGLFLYAIALGMLPFIKSLIHLWIFAGLIGSAAGFITVVFFAIWAQAFGRAHLGRIQGAAQILTVLSSAIGPLLFAKCAAVTGSYTPMLIGLAVIVLALGFAALTVAAPKLARVAENVIPGPSAEEFESL